MPHQGLLHPEPFPCSRSLLTHTSTGDTQTQFWLSLCGVVGSCCAHSLFKPSEGLWRRLGTTVACRGVRGIKYNSPGTNNFEGGCPYCHYPVLVWPQAKLQGGSTAHPSKENLIKDLLSMNPLIKARPRFPHSQSLP